VSGFVTQVTKPYRSAGVFRCPSGEINQQIDTRREAVNCMSILWIILIVILVLALLGFFSRGYW
jgi:hypothetical protein